MSIGEAIGIEVAGEIWKPRFGGFWAQLFGARERRIDTFRGSWRVPAPAAVRTLDHRSGVKVRVTVYASGRVKVTVSYQGAEVLDWEDSWVRVGRDEVEIPFKATVGVRVQGAVTLRRGAEV